VRRDYTSGELTAAEWREFRGELEPEMRAAESEVERLRGRLAEVEADASLDDVEADVLAKLARIRAAIAGEISDRDGVAAVQAALMRLFDGFVLHAGTPSEAHVELIGEPCWIEPIVSSQAVADYDDELRPVLGERVDVPLGDGAPLARADLLPEQRLHPLDALYLDGGHRAAVYAKAVNRPAQRRP